MDVISISVYEELKCIIFWICATDDAWQGAILSAASRSSSEVNLHIVALLMRLQKLASRSLRGMRYLQLLLLNAILNILC
jgi:hypothetical protein